MFQELNLSKDKTRRHARFPLVMGCFIADKGGITLLQFEIFKGALEYYLKGDDESKKSGQSFDMEVIPMFFSALEKFACKINIHDFVELPINGSNIKMHALFYFEYFTLIFLVHPHCKIERLKFEIITFFNSFFHDHEAQLTDISTRSSTRLKTRLEHRGRQWLMELNQDA